MAKTSVEKKLRLMPEFKALEGVCAALSPLDPEGRRKVIEAVHALLTISSGKQQARDGKAKASRRKG